jgi:hypothetical protein
MDVAAEANARLRELGYEETDASVERKGAADRFRLGGDLLKDLDYDPDDLLDVVSMLPPKADLLAYRVVLGLPAGTKRGLTLARPEEGEGGALVSHCAWCGAFSLDGKHWFQPNLSQVAGQRLTGAVCPSCFGRLAPDVPYPRNGYG